MPRTQDLTGKQFGLWTVVKKVNVDKPGTHWECQCICGKKKVLSASRLTPKSGSRACPSCKRVKDLTGKRFGSWTVISRDFTKKGANGNTYWNCVCSCGKETSVISKNLTSGVSIQCGSCAQKHNLVGKTFGRLTVIRDTGERAHNGSVRWECQCECGNRVTVSTGNLTDTRYKVKSCGCYTKEQVREMSTTHGLSQVNGKKTKLFMTWDAMKQRCHNPNNQSYHYYGGRGIKVCNEWLHDFKAFHDWSLENGFADNLSIDRRDNNKGYSPDNCRWVDHKTQIRNRRNTVTYQWNGGEYTVVEISEMTGINKNTLESRLRRGLSIEQAVKEPVSTTVLTLTYNGETKPIKQWCKELGLSYSTVRNRHYKGWSDTEAITGIRNK